MKKIIARLKPGVPIQVHLLLAAFLWTAVGMSLIVRGTSWLLDGGYFPLFFAAILLGSLKSFFILDKSAKKSIDRIQQLANGSCLGAVYSIKTWGLVVAMMTLGYFLRRSGVPLLLLGMLYVSIGWTLCFSSRYAWRAWWKML